MVWWRLLPLLALLAAITAAFIYIEDGAASTPEDVPEFACDHSEAAPAAAKLSKLLTFRTVSTTATTSNVENEDTFHAAWAYAEEAFPLIWKHLKVEKVGTSELSRLFTWPGKDPSLPPLLLIGHMDVVPAGDEVAWTYPAFGGQEAEGYIWGRGAIDMKQIVAAIFEAMQQLLQAKEGFVPARDVLFAVGQDEEVGGSQGAAQIAKLVTSRYGKVDFILDEGGTLLTDGIPPMTTAPLHVICTAEKGFINLDVNITGEGGHSSMPPSHTRTALGRAAAFVTYLKAHPMRARLQPPFSDTLGIILPTLPKPLRVVLKRGLTWPLSAVLAYLLRMQGQAAGANVHTTMVVTRINGGVADNVVPETVSMRLNIRPLPGDTMDQVLAHVRKCLKAVRVREEDFTMQVLDLRFDASEVTSAQSHHFKLVKQAVQETCRIDGKPLPVAAALLPGGTDSRRFRHLTLHGTLRITSSELGIKTNDLQRVHGVDERVRKDDFLRTICTYRRIIQLLAS